MLRFGINSHVSAGAVGALDIPPRGVGNAESGRLRIPRHNACFLARCGEIQ